jgi:D-tagatose-1,6-bisphosphate aldolase subunit GatZ/KbaZ
MNPDLRERAHLSQQPLMDFILRRIKVLEKETGIRRTIFAACPNSRAVIRAALRSARRNNGPIKFAATLNQVDMDGGYTHMTQEQFIKIIREEAGNIHFTGPVIVAVDHGGPWLKDIQRTESWSLDKSMDWIKISFEAAIDAGYDLIHVDPTIDLTLKKGEIIDIDVVVDRTVELIEHTEKYRQSKGLKRISYEVGTEEVHGGLANMEVFNHFLVRLKKELSDRNLSHAWPCFIVGKVGTDLHTTVFDPVVAKELTATAARYGSYIKGHYSDNVENPELYPVCGMGAANVGPEFTEKEYDGLMELAGIEKSLLSQEKIPELSHIKEVIWKAVIDSHRWEKWLNEKESRVDFYANSPQRQEWLVKTCARYIWENEEVQASRKILYNHIQNQGMDADEILLSHIEKAMDRYYHSFNLVDLNNLL